MSSATLADAESLVGAFDSRARPQTLQASIAAYREAASSEPILSPSHTLHLPEIRLASPANYVGNLSHRAEYVALYRMYRQEFHRGVAPALAAAEAMPTTSVWTNWDQDGPFEMHWRYLQAVHAFRERDFAEAIRYATLAPRTRLTVQSFNGVAVLVLDRVRMLADISSGVDVPASEIMQNSHALLAAGLVTPAMAATANCLGGYWTGQPVAAEQCAEAGAVGHLVQSLAPANNVADTLGHVRQLVETVRSGRR